MISVFLFVKGTADTPVESLVAQAQVAASMDTLERLRSIPEVGQIIVATGSSEISRYAKYIGAQVELDPPDQNFHFGNRLASLVNKYRAEQPLYIGGGSGVFMGQTDWGELAERVTTEPNSVFANNYYSCDFCGWSPGDAISRIAPPALDNDLAYRLGERAGLHPRPLDKNAATQFDIDTPADLLILAAVPPAGEHIGQWVTSASLDASRVRQLAKLIQTPTANLIIMGRVSASMAMYLERETRCQWRILSEERGMRASGREERGEVLSLLGYLIDAVGPQELMSELGRLADGVVLDTRVLFAHRRLHPTASDRFYSDLLVPERIHDPFIRDLTAAAHEASFPILLGGHSVVSGGVFALNKT